MSSQQDNAQDKGDGSDPKIEYTMKVGNYKIGKTIGKGTFGKVKLGEHIITKEKVAIKILEKNKILDDGDRTRISREIKILRQIRHPYIVQLYEIIETPNKLFLIMEFAPNGELFDFIVNKTRLKEKEASKFLQQILCAVDYLHTIGIVHRDLKPENLLLDHNNQIKDFGLSNMYLPGQTLGTACGSPCYAAPEMVAGKKYHGLQTDIWSCGIILYAMICGYLPFEDPNTSVLYKKIMTQDFKVPSFITEKGKQMLNGILCKDPQQRFTIQQIRDHEFCKQVTQPITQGIIVGKNEIPIDQHILNQLPSCLQVDYEQAKAMIQNNKHNSVTSTYYLMLLKHIRNGGYSTADLKYYKPTPIQKSDTFITTQTQQLSSNDINGMANGIANGNSDQSNCNHDQQQKISGTGGSNELDQIVQNKLQKFMNTNNNNKELQNLNNSIDIQTFISQGNNNDNSKSNSKQSQNQTQTSKQMQHQQQADNKNVIVNNFIRSQSPKIQKEGNLQQQNSQKLSQNQQQLSQQQQQQQQQQTDENGYQGRNRGKSVNSGDQQNLLNKTRVNFRQRKRIQQSEHQEQQLSILPNLGNQKQNLNLSTNNNTNNNNINSNNYNFSSNIQKQKSDNIQQKFSVFNVPYQTNQQNKSINSIKDTSYQTVQQNVTTLIQQKLANITRRPAPSSTKPISKTMNIEDSLNNNQNNNNNSNDKSHQVNLNETQDANQKKSPRNNIEKFYQTAYKNGVENRYNNERNNSSNIAKNITAGYSAHVTGSNEFDTKKSFNQTQLNISHQQQSSNDSNNNKQKLINLNQLLQKNKLSSGQKRYISAPRPGRSMNNQEPNSLFLPYKQKQQRINSNTGHFKNNIQQMSFEKSPANRLNIVQQNNSHQENLDNTETYSKYSLQTMKHPFTSLENQKAANSNQNKLLELLNPAKCMQRPNQYDGGQTLSFWPGYLHTDEDQQIKQDTLNLNHKINKPEITRSDNIKQKINPINLQTVYKNNRSFNKILKHNFRRYKYDSRETDKVF